ncbi:MAG TPA: AAA family ATPase [Kiritimatiellia bacterium]|nr:AAA family ATPase [Kiritimatiellia bacterium]
MNAPDPIFAMPDPEPDALDALAPGGANAFTPDVRLVGGADFTGFYDLEELPFSDAVNPKYFYKTDGHDEALIRLELAVRHDMSLGLVTGPSGSGKTLLSQLLLQRLDPVKTQAALVLVAPGMGKTALLKALMGELGLPIPEGYFVSAQALLAIIQDHVIALHREGRKLVVLIDECHFLASDSLHMVRTLSNLETPEKKLVTLLLFGEPGFLRRLNHPTHESLRNRLYLRSELQPFSAEETEQFVKFRLMMAGRMDDLFTADAFPVLHECSGGISRRINKLCTLALLEGFLARAPFIDAARVRAAAQRM